MKKIFLITFLSLPFLIYSQTEENRKGKLFFKIGTEYRITPLPYDAEVDLNNGLTNIDYQNSGFAVNYSLDYFVTKNLSLGFTHSFRYALLLYNDNISFEDIPVIDGSSKAKKTLMMDYHFYLDYHFKVFKKAEIFVRVGKSLANRGSNYSRVTSYFDQEGNLLGKSTGQNNFQFQPENFGLGYKKDKLEIMAGVLTTKVTNYFLSDERLTVPYLKLSYNLGKL